MYTYSISELQDNGTIFFILAIGTFFVYMLLKFKKLNENQHAGDPSCDTRFRTPQPKDFGDKVFVNDTQSFNPVIPKYTNLQTNYLVNPNKKENLDMNDIKRSMAMVAVRSTGKTGVIPTKGKSDVVQVRATSDRNYYFVAKDLKDKVKAANKLAEINRRSRYLIQAIDEQLDGHRRIIAGDGVDITDNMKQLVRTHLGKDIPFAEYHNPSDMTVGSNSDKGVMIETCLRNKYDPSDWNSDNTNFRVHTHELAHSADFEYRADGDEGHGPVFRRIHQYLLTVSENLGLYNCGEYKRSGNKFCGVKLSENYCGAGGGPKKQ